MREREREEAVLIHKKNLKRRKNSKNNTNNRDKKRELYDLK